MSNRVKEILAEIRKNEIKGWIAALSGADNRAALSPDRVLRTYQVNYRIESVNSTDQDTPRERREAVVEVLRSLDGEHHSGTSTWIIKLYIPKAADIAALLAAPLDKTIDFISVSEIVPSNSHRIGDAQLQS